MSIEHKSYFVQRDKRLLDVGAKNLSLCVGLEVPFFNTNASEEKKARGKAP